MRVFAALTRFFRHIGQTMALADLMRRLGHSSSVAALRYLHAVEGRDKDITQNLSRMARADPLFDPPAPATVDEAAQRPVI